MQRLWSLLLLRNRSLTESDLQEIGSFLIEKFGLDKTSIWNLDSEYLDDLCGVEA